MHVESWKLEAKNRGDSSHLHRPILIITVYLKCPVCPRTYSSSKRVEFRPSAVDSDREEILGFLARGSVGNHNGLFCDACGVHSRLPTKKQDELRLRLVEEITPEKFGDAVVALCLGESDTTRYSPGPDEVPYSSKMFKALDIADDKTVVIATSVRGK